MKCTQRACDTEPIARGLCSMHYQRAKLRGKLDQYSWNDDVSEDLPAFGYTLSGQPPRAKDRGHHLVCSEPKCKRPHLARGLCKPHYHHARHVGVLDRYAKGARPEQCSVDGCDGPHEARGLCVKHYKRAKRRDTLHLAPKERRRNRQLICSVPYCAAERRAKNLCQNHYNEAKRQWLTGETHCDLDEFIKTYRPAKVEKVAREYRLVNKVSVCVLPGCDRSASRLGLCAVHYNRAVRSEDLDQLPAALGALGIEVEGPEPKPKLTPVQVREIDSAVRKARNDFQKGVITRQQLDAELEACQQHARHLALKT